MSGAEAIIQDLKLEPHPEGGHFVECIIAPGYDEGSLEILSQKKN